MSLKTDLCEKEELQLPLKPDSGSSGETHFSRGLPWLKLGRESNLEIVPDANDILKKQRGYINMVMVCGNVRTGKSYLMNALLDQQVFGVSDQAASFTTGVEICPNLVPMSHFCGQASSSDPQIAFVDMEGQGDKGIKQDVKVATPLLLISKAVILNEICPAGPAKDVILEKLEVMMYAAQCVQIRRDRRQLFGCLHIILRDCPQCEEECHGIIFAKEDVNVAETDEHAEAIQKRNDIRSAIALAFESSRVWCLPKIIAEAAPPCYRDAGDAYAGKVDALRLELATQLATPKMVNGCKLTGSMIATLLPQVADEIKKEHPALSPPSLMDRVIEAEATILADELMQSARSELDISLRKRLPVDQEELVQQANSIKNRIKEQCSPMAPEEPMLRGNLAARCEWPTDERACTLIVEKFEAKFATALAELTLQNFEQITKLLREVEQELTSRVSDQLRAVELPTKPEQLKHEMERVQGNLHAELTNRLHAAPVPQREAVQQRIAEMAARIEKEMCKRNVDLFIDTVERDVTATAQEQLEGLKLPQQTDRLHSLMQEITKDMIAKLVERLQEVTVPNLPSVKHRALDKMRLVEDSLRARNAQKLSQWLREAEAEHEVKTNEHLEELRLPLRIESLKEKIKLVRSSSGEALEERLRIVHPEEAHGVRQRLAVRLQQLEEDILKRNSSSLLQKAKENEEKTVATFETSISNLRLPCSKERLQKRVDRIRVRLLSDVDLSIHSEKEAQEIRKRIETQFQTIENELMTKNAQELWRRRWWFAFNMFWLIVFLSAVTFTMDVMKVISLKSISCTLATGTEHTLALVWKAPASVMHLRENCCADETGHDDDEEELTEEEERAGQEAEEAWQAAEDESIAFAKRLNRKEMLRWLPVGTGMGIIGVTMCLWSRH